MNVNNIVLILFHFLIGLYHWWAGRQKSGLENERVYVRAGGQMVSGQAGRRVTDIESGPSAWLRG